ncbi:ATP-dependent Clp protease proteolytic subunit [Bradyrhizobium stylosanthis]|uniref:ClpP protease-like protein n=1 Tax=Bradyrhizobium stylosanthis TaxID=1803665 RepID=A0A560DPT2_9BRAD|nr:ATP-dependent Clp protease proteolytic subunit [Bradyrhizobium stylosanthis]TWA99127.1 hypothetical protein FBZ96_10495 [Bradyrhizobium stylosanthis]
MKAIVAILAVPAFFLLLPTADGAAVKSVPGRAGKVVIHVSGRFVEGDTEAFMSAFNKAKEAGRPVENVFLNSSGGSLAEGARLATAIKFGRLATMVPDGAMCASACFLAFAAGEPRFAAPTALIGVHKAAEKHGRETKSSAVATALMAQMAKELGVPSSIVGRMVATPPNQIAWLDASDLRAMNVKRDVRDTGAFARPSSPSSGSERASSAAASLSAASTGPGHERQSWNDFLDKAIALSAEQNQGAPAMVRSCTAESKVCALGVTYLLEDGRRALVTVMQDQSGVIIRREVCKSNSTNDYRDCADWDSGAQYRDFKTEDGHWVQGVSTMQH